MTEPQGIDRADRFPTHEEAAAHYMTQVGLLRLRIEELEREHSRILKATGGYIGVDAAAIREARIATLEEAPRHTVGACRAAWSVIEPSVTAKGDAP